VWAADGYPIIAMSLLLNAGQNHAMKRTNKSFDNVPSSSNVE
jgi:hypothetical protein